MDKSQQNEVVVRGAFRRRGIVYDGYDFNADRNETLYFGRNGVPALIDGHNSNVCFLVPGIVGQCDKRKFKRWLNRNIGRNLRPIQKEDRLNG